MGQTHHFVTGENLETGEDPWCRLEWLSKPGLTAAEELLLVRATMPPGQGHRFHRHPAQEEILYFLSGAAEQWVGEEKRLLGPGEIAHIPKDTVHATFNPGPDPLVFLAVLSPATVEGDTTMDMSDKEPWATLLQRREDA